MLPGKTGEVLGQFKRVQVQERHSSRARDPQSSIVVFTAHVHEVTDERRVVLCREPDEGIAVVSNQAAAEGADPGVPLDVEVNAVDVHVWETVLPGHPAHDHVVFRLRLGIRLPGEQQQAGKNRQ